MHSLRGKRGLFGALALALAAAVSLPSPAYAGPDKSAPQANAGRYRLFAGNLGAITINRIYYGLNTKGEVGVDSTNSSTIGGGFWPKGTGNQYMFNSGLQVSGIIQGGADNPWAGDTTGGLFFDASGLRPHGTGVTEIFNAANPVDVANWPQAAYVPLGDESELLFDGLLRGRTSASQGDVWFMTTEADPALNAARPHPLGILAEYRVLGWNFPTGNEDLLYLIVTFYNVTTTDPAAYAHHRPGMRELLVEQGQLFHTLNNAEFGVTLPTAGYTIDPFYAAFSSDPDVTSAAGTNFASVNLPFAMGMAWHRDFPRAAGWTFSPDIFGAPFFAGSGFVGIKFLKSAGGPGEINLFATPVNAAGSPFPDPDGGARLYKYLSGTIGPADGISCNHGDPLVTKICYIRNTTATDVRTMQSSTPLTLAPGASASIVVSYIHAAPVQIPGYASPTPVPVGEPRRLVDPVLLAQGANKVDSLTGFLGYTDANEDGIVQQDEINAVTGSLLQKAKLAQQIFDEKFLLPFAPEAPEFFLIPGDGSVTVMWRPSVSETEGDPFFEVAKDAQIVPDGGGAPVPNALYDANYRKFDVEGYRIYRGRADTPTSLKLIAQFDYAGTLFRDYTGQVPNQGSRCAPEIGVTGTCVNIFDVPTPGVQLVKNVAYNLTGNVVQIGRGQRTLLASGDVINLSADTAVVGRASGFPPLTNTGVPFLYVDNEVTNGLTYFYAVTAFDVNSVNSTGAGNTSLESARITERIVPGSRSGNYVNEGSIAVDGVYGRGVKLTDNTPMTIDPATGKFNKRALPSNGLTATIAGFVRSVVSGSGQISIRLDSIILGDPNANVPHTYYFGVGDDAGRNTISIAIDPSETQGTAPPGGNWGTRASTGWSGGSADPDLAGLYGGGPGFRAASGTVTLEVPGSYFTTIYGRGCVNALTNTYPQFGPTTRACSYNGPRWFAGDNETKDHPNAANFAFFNRVITQPAVPPVVYPNIDNAGELPGVAHLQFMLSYENTQSTVQNFESILSGGMSAGDFRVYWGGGGVVDSVIDLTHNVPVPFDTRLGPTWGILNQAATTAVGSFDQRPTVLTLADLGCVTGVKGKTNGALYACAAATVPYALSQTAAPGTISFFTGNTTISRTSVIAANTGFVFYLKGFAFMMELTGGQLPSAGTQWTMRSYAGGVVGGQGLALVAAFPDGNMGPYSFNEVIRPFNAVGAELVMAYNVTNENVASNAETLARVHTVPDPYYVTSAFEATTTSKIIHFVNLPAQATIRIFTTSGVLVRVLKHETTTNGGEATWDVRNRNNQFVASGVYFYHVTAENGETTTGRMTIVNYAP